MQRLALHNFKNLYRNYHSGNIFIPKIKKATSLARAPVCQCYQKTYLELDERNHIKNLIFYPNKYSETCALIKCNIHIRNKMINRNILDFLYIKDDFFYKYSNLLPIERNCMQITKENIHNILNKIY